MWIDLIYLTLLANIIVVAAALISLLLVGAFFAFLDFGSLPLW